MSVSVFSALAVLEKYGDCRRALQHDHARAYSGISAGGLRQQGAHRKSSEAYAETPKPYLSGM